jgi:hypothetical protein
VWKATEPPDDVAVPSGVRKVRFPQVPDKINGALLIAPVFGMGER